MELLGNFLLPLITFRKGFFFFFCLVCSYSGIFSSLQSFQRASLPKFLIRGHLNSTNCVITQPLMGELVVESAEAAVKSIELQLVRVETCGEPLSMGRAGNRLQEFPPSLHREAGKGIEEMPEH